MILIELLFHTSSNIWIDLNLAYECSSFVRKLFTRRNLFEILLNQPKIRLYLPFSDLFGTRRMSVWFQINRKMVNKIWFQVDLIRFRKDFSVYIRNVNTNEQFLSYIYMDCYSGITTTRTGPSYSTKLSPRINVKWI